MENLGDRKTYIGGSDIAAVMGMSRFKTRLQLWAEKTGKVPMPDLSDKEAVDWGKKLEALVAQEFSERTGLKVRRDLRTFEHKDYPFMKAHIDRRITGSDELLECKTTSAYNLKEWESDEVPAEYILQVQWYLGILGMRTGYIACLIGGNKFMHKEIQFNQFLFDTMVLEALTFWRMVENDQQPEATAEDNSSIVELYPSNNSNLIEATSDIDTAIARRQELDMHIKELGKQKDEIEAKLKVVIGENDGIYTENYQATWKTQATKRLDSQALKDAGIYEQYLKESVSRVLRIKKQTVKKGVAA